MLLNQTRWAFKSPPLTPPPSFLLLPVSEAVAGSRWPNFRETRCCVAVAAVEGWGLSVGIIVRAPGTAWLLFFAINSTSEVHICSQFCLVLLREAFRPSSERTDKRGSSAAAAAALDNEQQRLVLPNLWQHASSCPPHPPPNTTPPHLRSLTPPPVRQRRPTLDLE